VAGSNLIDERWPLCRLYFNQHDDKDGVWSLDAGEGTKEVKAQKVIIDTRNWARTIYDKNCKDVEKCPRAWIEFGECRIDGTVGKTIEIRD
jgi:hypothetical protein